MVSSILLISTYTSAHLFGFFYGPTSYLQNSIIKLEVDDIIKAMNICSQIYEINIRE